MKELAKRGYYKDLLEKTRHDPGLLWKSVNDIVNYKLKSSSTMQSEVTTSDEQDNKIHPTHANSAILSMIISRLQPSHYLIIFQIYQKHMTVLLQL